MRVSAALSPELCPVPITVDPELCLVLCVASVHHPFHELSRHLLLMLQTSLPILVFWELEKGQCGLSEQGYLQSNETLSTGGV